MGGSWKHWAGVKSALKPSTHCRRLSSFIYFAQILGRKYEALRVPLFLLIGFKQFLLHTPEQWIPSVHQDTSDINPHCRSPEFSNFFWESIRLFQWLQIQTLNLRISEASDKMNPLMLRVWAGIMYISVSRNTQAEVVLTNWENSWPKLNWLEPKEHRLSQWFLIMNCHWSLSLLSVSCTSCLSEDFLT